MIGSGRVLGLDLGSRRIGVAVTDEDQSVAVPVTTILRSGDRTRDHRAVASLVEEYAAVGVVVGLPTSLSGGEGPAARAAGEEAAELRRRLDVDVDTADERLTSVLAASGRRSARVRRSRRAVDEEAAALLLQTWADRRRSPGA